MGHEDNIFACGCGRTPTAELAKGRWGIRCSACKTTVLPELDANAQGYQGTNSLAGAVLQWNRTQDPRRAVHQELLVEMQERGWAETDYSEPVDAEGVEVGSYIQRYLDLPCHWTAVHPPVIGVAKVAGLDFKITQDIVEAAAENPVAFAWSAISNHADDAPGFDVAVANVLAHLEAVHAADIKHLAKLAARVAELESALKVAGVAA